jgi:ribosome-associated protein
VDKELLLSEITFRATRSSGPGGQHVNKTSTRVELSWSLEHTRAFTPEQVYRLREKLKNRLTKENVLQLASSQSRSQHRNKEDVIQRFFSLLDLSLQKSKPRKKTRPSLAAKRKRLKAKKVQSDKKANRKKPDF